MGARSFAGDRRGVAAVEFALILPMIALVFFGLYELSNGVACRERVELLASTTSDLVAQAKIETAADVSDVFAAADAILYPYPAGAHVVLTSLLYVDDTHGQVDWSKSSDGSSAYSHGDVVQVNSGVIANGGSVIMSEASYDYVSPLHMVVPQTITMTSKFFSRPRRSVTISCGDC